MLVTREPGGCPIADAIRSILLDPASEALVPRAELLLYAAARAQHVEEVIAPALRRGTDGTVRSLHRCHPRLSGIRPRADLSLIAELNRLAAGGLEPDLTILLDLPVEDGLRRARRRNSEQALGNEDRFEREALTFHRRVRQGYLELARREVRFRIIDARGPEEEVAARVATAVDAFSSPGGVPREFRSDSRP